MNKTRRCEIKKNLESLEAIKTNLACLKEEEETAYDNLPESLQESDKGDAMQDAINSLEDAIDAIDESIDALCGIEGL